MVSRGSWAALYHVNLPPPSQETSLSGDVLFTVTKVAT
jgi:hypothetical protein